MHLAEPMTVATDYLLAAVAVPLGARLLRRNHPARLWAWAFFATGFAAVTGGSSHGFALHLSRPANAFSERSVSSLEPERGLTPREGLIDAPARSEDAIYDALWLVTYGAIGLANLLLLAGAFVAFAPRRWHGWLHAALLLRFAAYFAVLAARREFRYVVYDYGVTLAVLLALGLLALVRREPSGPWIVSAVALSTAGALIQRSGLALHAHFNHNDLFHVVQMAGVWLFYRAGLLVPDQRFRVG